MNVHITYKLHKTPAIEKEINHLTDKVSKRLQVFRPELVHLRGSLEENSPREGTVVSLNLRLPTGQLAAHRSAANGIGAVKAAFDDLLQQITKHKGLLRTTHNWPRRRTRTSGLRSRCHLNRPWRQCRRPRSVWRMFVLM